MSCFRLSSLLLLATLPLLLGARQQPEPTRSATDASQDPPPLGEREAAVRDWIDSNAIPLATVEAGKGFADMQPVRALVGEARIVSLGESTHGSREIFQMKHRMLEFLVEEMGFTVFAIEASLPDCIPINDYILHGRGDAATAVAGQGFWTWNTEEVIDLVEWMRTYNVDPSNAGKPRLKFYGFDMQAGRAAVNAVLQYLKEVDPDAAVSYARLLQHPGLHPMQREDAPQAALDELNVRISELATLLDKNQTGYAGRSSDERFAIIRRCAVVAEQALENAASMGGPHAVVQRLHLSLPPQMKDLAAFLEGHPEFGDQASRELVAETQEMRRFIASYYGADWTQRALWEEVAADLVKGLSESTLAPAQRHFRVQQAQVLVKLLTALRGAIEKPPPQPRLNIRDRSMAQNIQWILEHEGPDTRIVCWSHNGHANISPGDPEQIFSFMGSYLEEWFNEDHLPIGFTFGRGSFQAVAARAGIIPAGTRGMPEWTVGWPREGSVDSVFAAAEAPLYIVDVRPDRIEDEQVRDWLITPRPWRMIGAIFDPTAEQDFYRPIAPGVAFEAIIHIDHTTRARPSVLASQVVWPLEAVPQRPMLGVQFESAVGDEAGLHVIGLVPGYPAEAAGMREGDRIIRVGTRRTRTAAEVSDAVEDEGKPGASLPVVIARNEQQLTIEVVFREPTTQPTTHRTTQPS